MEYLRLKTFQEASKKKLFGISCYHPLRNTKEAQRKISKTVEHSFFCLKSWIEMLFLATFFISSVLAVLDDVTQEQFSTAQIE